MQNYKIYTRTFDAKLLMLKPIKLMPSNEFYDWCASSAILTSSTI